PVLGVGAPGVRLDRDHRVACVVLAREERVLLQPRELAAHVAQHGLELLVGERAGTLTQELDVRDELVIAPELLLRALMLGGEASGALLVVPEVGLRELLLELVEADLQRSGVKGNHGPSRAGSRSPRAARRAGSVSRQPPWRSILGVSAVSWIERDLEVENRGAVDRFECGNVDPGRRLDRRDRDAMESDRIRPVRRARREHSGQRPSPVATRADLKDVARTLVEPGDRDEVHACSPAFERSNESVVEFENGRWRSGARAPGRVLSAPK